MDCVGCYFDAETLISDETLVTPCVSRSLWISAAPRRHSEIRPLTSAEAVMLARSFEVVVPPLAATPVEVVDVALVSVELFAAVSVELLLADVSSLATDVAAPTVLDG